MTRSGHRPRLSQRLLLTALVGAAAAGVSPAEALAQRYDVGVTTFARAEPGAALLVLDGSGEIDPRFSAEALVWAGYDYDGGAGDVLVMALRVRDRQGRAAARLGRMLIHSGALRPLHLDGAYATARGPGELRLEAFAGVPVMPRGGDRAYDWALGTRLSRPIGDYGAVGLSYAYMRDDGQRADQEIGLDLGLHITEGLDFDTKLSIDLFNPGIAELLATLVYRKRDYRAELFYSDRDPSRMLRSNSLFTVLGAFASRRIGASLGVRAAPRLDVRGSAAVRIIDLRAYESLLVEATLRLDREGNSSLRGSARREGAPGKSWTGLRGAARIRLAESWSASAELELVIPDDSDGRGKVWPWARLGAQWIPAENWQLDLAVEARSTPNYRYAFDSLGRVSYRIGGP